MVMPISDINVLQIGSGGVGCEILKNLASSGFNKITIIDLDTIELSNLNRQFLFKSSDIGKPKATAAAASVKNMCPKAIITPIQDNIKNHTYNSQWFSNFDIVINALDNLGTAPTHPSFIFISYHLFQPIELYIYLRYIFLLLTNRRKKTQTGTAGYTGQTTVIKRGITECFECQPKPLEQKVYPVCTIRNTPSTLVHCVVWAKDYLFIQLFGNESLKESDSMVQDPQIDEKEQLKMAKESQSLKNIMNNINSPDFPKLVFDSMFGNNISELLKLDDMWKNRPKPIPIFFDQLSTSQINPDVYSDINDNKLLSTESIFHIWVSSLDKLKSRYLIDQDIGLQFDKDDEDALRFVGSSANLRASVFGINTQSLFQIKAIAGNIIPAIATTNAIIAGLAVIQASKIASKDLSSCKTIYYAYGGRRPQFLYKEPLLPPNPNCSICQSNYYKINVNFNSTTIQQIADCVTEYLSENINISKNRLLNGSDSRSPDIPHDDIEDVEFSIIEGSRILYDFDFDDNADKTLADLNIQCNNLITIVFDPHHYTTLILCPTQSESEISSVKLGKLSSDHFFYPYKTLKPRQKLPEKDQLHPITNGENASQQSEPAQDHKLPLIPSNHTNNSVVILDDDDNNNGSIDSGSALCNGDRNDDISRSAETGSQHVHELVDDSDSSAEERDSHKPKRQRLN
ncbi:Ubiquitin-activating enzyme E1-like [Smittium culicis]|uniref:Ubiquitin-activating enzyme E1-like n=1 Tax=Smittium culicis TaxID=133412 RepID=A0A1R1X858_9FUNG|nr:Ubiquitin-activating enzyme E1-like [Smittium culicis]